MGYKVGQDRAIKHSSSGDKTLKLEIFIVISRLFFSHLSYILIRIFQIFFSLYVQFLVSEHVDQEMGAMKL